MLQFFQFVKNLLNILYWIKKSLLKYQVKLHWINKILLKYLVKLNNYMKMFNYWTNGENKFGKQL